jgi:hypothetical protein
VSLKDIRPALRAFLLADAAISSAVGASRIYPDEMPQGVTATSLVFQEISNVGDHHMQGPSGLARPRMQVTAWATTRDAAYALGLLVKDRLDGYVGVMGTGGDAVTVQGVFFDNSRNLKDDAASLYGRQQDFIIWFEER